MNDSYRKVQTFIVNNILSHNFSFVISHLSFLLSFPIVCPEWEERQAACIRQIAELEILEAITECYRLLDLRTGYDDALIPRIIAWLPEMLGCGRMEDLVFAGNFKTFDALKAVVGSKFVVEMYFDCIVHYLHLLESH